MKKMRRIEAELELIDERLAAAHKYVTRGVNVEGCLWLHLDDWRGNSGHPLWMKSVMIPATQKARARKEKALETLSLKSISRHLQQRRPKRIR